MQNKYRQYHARKRLQNMKRRRTAAARIQSKFRQLSTRDTLMEKRLANIITTPGMILAVIMASGLLYMQPVYLTQTWMQIKLLFVAFLLIYHFYCYKIMNELTNKQYNYSGQQLRALNELPTLLLVVVVMLVVFKNQFPTSAASWLIFALILFMAASIQFYAKWRRNRKQFT